MTAGPLVSAPYLVKEPPAGKSIKNKAPQPLSQNPDPQTFTYLIRGQPGLKRDQTRMGTICYWRLGRALLGGHAPEDHTSGTLDEFEALLQELSVAMPKLDVVGGSGSGLKSYGLADDESHGLGFQGRKLLGRLDPGTERTRRSG